jgi:hypothetical protein
LTHLVGMGRQATAARLVEPPMRGNYLTLLVVAECKEATVKVTVPLRRGNCLTQRAWLDAGGGGMGGFGQARLSTVLAKQ